MIHSAILGVMVVDGAERRLSRDESDRAIGADTTDSLNRLYALVIVRERPSTLSHRVTRRSTADRTPHGLASGVY
jgi:hypothetical protein